MKPSSNRAIRALLLSGVGLASTCGIATAQAQTAVPAADAPADANRTDAAPDNAGEIIVTAQRRAERLQDVPVTVSVVDSKQLGQQSITSVNDLGKAVPGLGAGFLGGTPSIRGVSTGGYSRSSEEAVSTVLDGVVLGRTAISQLFDVERVEVLSGPQGMLFGKNASAGVINIATVAPKLHEFEALGTAEYGSYDYLRTRATVNVPLGDIAAVRVSGFKNTTDSLVRNTLTGDRNSTQNWGGRGRLRIVPSSTLEINLIGDYEKTTGRGNFPFVFAILPSEDPFGTVTLDSQIAACGITVSPRNTRNCGEGGTARIDRTRKYGFSGQIDYTLPGDYILTSLTAKRFLRSGEFGYYGPGGDTDLVPANVFSRNLAPSRLSVFSQELRVTSPSNRTVGFVAGLYYSSSQSHDEIFQTGNLGFLPAVAADARGQVIDIRQKSYAVFGQATIHATDSLSFIAGGRFTHETLSDRAPVKSATELAAILAGQGLVYVPIGFGAGFIPVDLRIKTDNFSWRLGAQYEWSSRFMTFFTASRGYKGPAVSDQGARSNGAGGSVDPLVRAEIPMSYELGGKATVLDGRLFIGATVFHTDIKDFQTQVFAPAQGILPAGFIQGNAPKLKTEGVDVTIFGRPVKGVTLNAGAIYTRARYSSDFLVACAPQQIAGTGTCSAAGTTPAVDQAVRTPKWRLLLNGEYAHDLTSTVVGYVQADMQYQSKTFTSPTPDPIQRMPATIFVNGRVGVRSSDGAWGFSVWGRNLLDKHYNYYQPDFLALAGNGRLGVTPGSTPGYLTVATTDQRRTGGVTVDFRF